MTETQEAVTRLLAISRTPAHSSPMASPVLLGLECGGTRTVALAADADGHALAQHEAGPANLRLVTDAQLEAHFRALAGVLPAPSAIGVGMAGVRDRPDCQRVERILERVWPGVPRQVDHDLESALAAAEAGTPRKGSPQEPDARVIILSGTGSCCYGRDRQGRTAKVGGWGHHLGDRGSAYDIAFRALREAAHELDHAGTWSRFGGRALRSLVLNEPNDLIAWLQGAGKTEVAALAPEVFAAAAEGDRGARRVVADTASILASDALACARRLVPGRVQVQFVLAGSVVLKQSGLVRQLSAQIRKARPGSTIGPLPRESVWGAVVMARRAWEGRTAAETAAPDRSAPTRKNSSKPNAAPAVWIPATRSLSPTEQRNPRSERLDRMRLSEAITLMLEEEASVTESLKPHRAALAQLIQLTAQSFRFGGRLFYVGAGTSGRLGVLDASECPPTFRTPPEQVQGIMAGGIQALHSAVEGAEDDAGAGAQAVVNRGVGWRDVVVGIAASGRTPFVWGALSEARQRGAITALICFNPHLDFREGWKPEVVLAVDVGPEVLTGSTRLKAGTATKLLLNQLTTLAMVQSGKVIGNLMVDLNPSNVKLRDRACRIVAELTGRDAETVHRALSEGGWRVKETVLKLGRATARKSGSLPVE
jgi:N-acetylmuramic acid 6-phosphate etherase